MRSRILYANLGMVVSGYKGEKCILLMDNGCVDRRILKMCGANEKRGVCLM